MRPKRNTRKGPVELLKKEINEMEKTICCICGKEFEGWGNNPWPIKPEGKCCDECNFTVVVPARMESLKEHGRNK